MLKNRERVPICSLFRPWVPQEYIYAVSPGNSDLWPESFIFLDITERCLPFPVIAANSGNRLIAKLCLHCLHLEYINLYRKMSTLDIKFDHRQYFGNQHNDYVAMVHQYIVRCVKEIYLNSLRQEFADRGWNFCCYIIYWIYWEHMIICINPRENLINMERKRNGLRECRQV